MNEKLAFKYFNFSVFLHFIGRLLYRTFIPIILLEMGYSLKLVLGYILLYSIVSIITSFISQHFFSKNNVILFNILAIISEIILLFLLIPNQMSWLIIIGIILFEGFYYGFYYMSYNSIINFYTSKKNIGNNLGNLGIVSSISSVLAPIIGAILLKTNYMLFILISIFFLLISIMPLLKIVNPDVNGLYLPKIKIKFIKREIFNLFLNGSFEVIIFFLWAIYIYIEGFSLLLIGFIPAAQALTNIFLTYTIKKKLVNKNYRYLIKLLSIFGIMFFSIYRFYFPSSIIITNLCLGLFFTAYNLGINIDFYEKVKGHQTYFSSMILDSSMFFGWIMMTSLALIIGLKYIILLPVILGLVYLVVNIKNLKINFK